MEQMPEDPWRAAEEARLQRAIDSVEYQKAQGRVTWTSYLESVIDQTLNLPEIENPLLEEKIEVLVDISNVIPRREKRSDDGVDVAEFDAFKTFTMKHILEAMMVLGYLMTSSKSANRNS